MPSVAADRVERRGDGEELVRLDSLEGLDALGQVFTASVPPVSRTRKQKVWKTAAPGRRRGTDRGEEAQDLVLAPSPRRSPDERGLDRLAGWMPPVGSRQPGRG